MELEAEKFLPEKISVLLDQGFVEGIARPKGGTARNAVDIKGDLPLLHTVVKRCADGGCLVKKTVPRDRKIVL